jgi:hypothetical protein
LRIYQREYAALQLLQFNMGWGWIIDAQRQSTKHFEDHTLGSRLVCS